VRAITPDDFQKFKKTFADLGDKARQGLTAEEALGLSRPADIDRARAEIRYSMPARLQAGKVHLVTDSGPRSKVTRHHVTVEFSMYSAALSRPGSATQAAQWLCKESPLRFECDCRHFRYFLRFTATAGGWVTGRPEHGFQGSRAARARPVVDVRSLGSACWYGRLLAALKAKPALGKAKTGGRLFL